MIITFVDAGVLIAAARGTANVSAKAMAILDDPNRSFASSEFIRLELMPKAVFNRKDEEAARPQCVDRIPGSRSWPRS